MIIKKAKVITVITKNFDNNINGNDNYKNDDDDDDNDDDERLLIAKHLRK